MQMEHLGIEQPENLLQTPPVRTSDFSFSQEPELLRQDH